VVFIDGVKWVYTGGVFGVKGNFRMKRFAVFILLGALSVAWSTPTRAQRVSVAENARRSARASKKQQKMLNKTAKRQRKAMKRAGKAQRKAVKKANRRLRKK
jgi:hypothetical protein